MTENYAKRLRSVLTPAESKVVRKLSSPHKIQDFIDTLPVDGPAVGYLLRFERSTYRGAERAADHLPLYFYEGERAYLHGTRAGLKFGHDDWRFDTFIALP